MQKSVNLSEMVHCSCISHPKYMVILHWYSKRENFSEPNSIWNHKIKANTKEKCSSFLSIIFSIEAFSQILSVQKYSLIMPWICNNLFMDTSLYRNINQYNFFVKPPVSGLMMNYRKNYPEILWNLKKVDFFPKFKPKSFRVLGANIFHISCFIIQNFES